jgi:NAD(P)-dependent dehydrogenase (short-subunit alcohol dehydrogenase family)
MTKLAGKIAMVTGAGSGIGQATAQIMAREGAHVVVTDLDPKSAAGTARMISDAGGMAEAHALDASEEGQIVALLAHIRKAHGRLDCAVNNAGMVGAIAPITDLTAADWDRTMYLNARGTWLCIKHEVEAMRETGGAIVNTSSGVTEFCTPNFTVYGASKAAVDTITRTVAVEWGPRGIRCNAVQPGNIGTPMMFGALTRDMIDKLGAVNPLRRIGTPEDVGEVVAFLCSDAAAYVNGETLTIDGGLSRQWIQF